MRLRWIGCGLWLSSLALAEMETRVHSFEKVSPAWVQRQIEQVVPDPHRVSMNPEGGQVIVVAEPETQERVAAMLRELSRPTRVLQLWIRQGVADQAVAVRDGTLLNLPVTDHPVSGVVERARGRLPPGQNDLPVAGALLRAQVHLLREDPAVARLRVVPVLLFGSGPPFQVVRFPSLQSEVLINTRVYLDLRRALSSHAFYREFLQTQPHPDHPPKPVGMLVSFRGVTLETAGGPEEGR